MKRGEAEAIVLAREIGADLILLDDPRARGTAAYMGLNKMGVIGILQLGVEEDLLIDIKQDLDELRKRGFRISDKLYSRTIQKGAGK
ncbi:MAG: DUF3368 domain-containing protein [Candidatus Zixiibacteriota bacterium]